MAVIECLGVNNMYVEYAVEKTKESKRQWQLSGVNNVTTSDQREVVRREGRLLILGDLAGAFRRRRTLHIARISS